MRLASPRLQDQCSFAAIPRQVLAHRNKVQPRPAIGQGRWATARTRDRSRIEAQLGSTACSGCVSLRAKPLTAAGDFRIGEPSAGRNSRLHGSGLCDSCRQRRVSPDFRQRLLLQFCAAFDIGPVRQQLRGSLAAARRLVSRAFAPAVQFHCSSVARLDRSERSSDATGQHSLSRTNAVPLQVLCSLKRRPSGTQPPITASAAVDLARSAVKGHLVSRSSVLERHLSYDILQQTSMGQEQFGYGCVA